MAVLVQKMITPDYSFVLHTVNPGSRNPEEAYIELAVGLGEILTSAPAPGTPYRMVCNKVSGEAQLLAFANLSYAIWPDKAGGIARKILDYSKVEMSRELEFHKALGSRLTAIARQAEDAFGQPQDIEGAIADGEIYLVQSRPQQGL